MQNYQELRVYQAARKLARDIYRLTPLLPAMEHYALRDQLQRASVSIVSNIAEGAGRSTPRDFCCFLDRALGSANEVASQLEIALDTGLLPGGRARPALATSIVVQRMLTSLITRIRGSNGPTAE